MRPSFDEMHAALAPEPVAREPEPIAALAEKQVAVKRHLEARGQPHPTRLSHQRFPPSEAKARRASSSSRKIGMIL